MSQVLALSEHQHPAKPAMDDKQLNWLCDSIISNRFLPVPPQEDVFVGDGDYRAIGAEFLGHFVRMGGLHPTEDVLDIGCGIGRIAVPLTQYLDTDMAKYCGLDPVASGIDWCKRAITPVYPNFRFESRDVRNELYNPEGAINGRSMRLPFQDGTFDFTAMISVATHLPPDEINTYCSEVFRVLRPGGRLFMTAFVIREEDQTSKPDRDARLTGFEKAEGKPCWHLQGENPMAAVGFDDAFIDGALTSAGFEIQTKSYGNWRGGDRPHYQDFLIAHKPRRGV
ncbi:MAG: class I SAM-dependent methyltransferase [Porticoccaceae bacterium]|uniref:class I SAM-dependent methyltransferase n=1 Tax=Thalassospira sp. TaxID=1912094 RepID=UPI003A86BC79